LKLESGKKNKTEVAQAVGQGMSMTSPSSPSAENAAAHGGYGFFVRQKANGDQLAAIAGLVVKGTVKVNVETVLPLPEARKAQELSKTGHSGGKIVLEVNGR